MDAHLCQRKRRHVSIEIAICSHPTFSNHHPFSLMNDPWRFLPCNYDTSELSDLCNHFMGNTLPSTPRKVTPRLVVLPSTQPKTADLSCETLNHLIGQVPPLLPYQVASFPIQSHLEISTPKVANLEDVPSGFQNRERIQDAGAVQEKGPIRKRKVKEPKPYIPPERVSQRKKSTQALDKCGLTRVCEGNAGTQRPGRTTLSPIKPSSMNIHKCQDASAKYILKHLKKYKMAPADPPEAALPFWHPVAKNTNHTSGDRPHSSTGCKLPKENQNTSSRSYYGCWTCRVRHTLCPADGVPCLTCRRYGYECDMAPSRPAYIKDVKKKSQRIRYLQETRQR